MPDIAEPDWNRALAHAVLNRVPDGLRHPVRADLEILLEDLHELVPGGLEAVRLEATAAYERGNWPYAIPASLRAGLGASQLLALLSQLQQRLIARTDATRPVVSSRPLTAEERRLLQDVPPHHGS